ncbi:MAG TPA: phosphodiester glycosidase family protein [Gemmatimonadales bacterium]|jgi:hypothetical protein|nr:phosphodiester glycosidase family protein [Gemmatimonadales bacterium]
MRLAGVLLVLALAPLASGPDPAPTLAVRASGGWETWWRADSAPERWNAPLPAVADRVKWRGAGRGLDWGELTLSGDGEAFRVRVIAVRVDPGAFEFRLILPARAGAFAGRWDIGEAPSEASLALNAGQFTDEPWGWVVQDGVERQSPRGGPLAVAVVLDTLGRLHLLSTDSIASIRPATRLAFQSYPLLLGGDGEVPRALVDSSLGVNLRHRDSRLALGELRDGRIILALTRFEALGGVLASLPLGLTTPEMAALMGALGARRAVLLDGGISSQLMIRDGARHRSWTGWRRVPLGLIGIPRAAR